MKYALFYSLLSLTLFSGCETINFDLPMALNKELTVEQIMTDLRDSEANLKRLCKQAESASASLEATADRATKALDKIQSRYDKLGQHADLPSEVEQEAQMIAMRSHYLLAQLIPGMNEAVAEQAQQIIEFRPESQDAAVAKVLKFCSLHDLNEPIKKPTLKQLKVDAASFREKQHGVILYSAVANEYWKNGKMDSAEKVLEAGIAQFRDSREKMPLVHQMIDQGHRNPPEPDLCQAKFKRMQRAMESSHAGASSAKIVFRS